MAKMWAGRFQKEEDSKVNDFNSSISFDGVMYEDDILGSMAHAKMLGHKGIISKEDSNLIIYRFKKGYRTMYKLFTSANTPSGVASVSEQIYILFGFWCRGEARPATVKRSPKIAER